MKRIYALIAKLRGRNLASTPKEVIQEQLNEKRPLPTGVKEFHDWSDRIIAGAMLTADPESQKFALANTLLHLSPTTAFETDLYFIHTLRKFAVNQVADAMRVEIRDRAKARLAAEEEAQKQNQAAVTPQGAADGEVLGASGV